MGEIREVIIGDCAKCPSDATVSTASILPPKVPGGRPVKGPVTKLCQKCFEKWLNNLGGQINEP